jgi:hypothetical protein
MKNKEVADFCIDMHRDRLTPSKLLQFMELLYSVSEPIRIILHLATPLSLIILPSLFDLPIIRHDPLYYPTEIPPNPAITMWM